LSISGRSITSESNILYDPLLKSLYLYSQNPKEQTEINIQLDYLNSDSNRSLMNLLILAEKIYRKGNQVIIRWRYKQNDTFMFEQGKIFMSLIEVPFSFEIVSG
jgi:hypothetical protein